ncbi:MAG: hypothetical protein IPM38_08130 [Ignavibacteria bacterium]|nr:hypothetical protein [Ignavibacteria bacterium]
MKKNFLIPQLLILPVILFITAGLLKFAQGPYYLNFYDPSYVYLINGLNLAQLEGFGVGHFDHPGTTVQVISAVVVKFYYTVSSSGTDIVSDVFARPEAYLIKINIFLNFINCLFLFLFGYFIYSLSKNIFLTFFLMLSPFASTELFYGMIIVTPDNLLISASLMTLGIIFYCLYKKEQTYSVAEVIVFAVIIAFGLATKLNFIPMLFIPMIILNGYKNKFLYLFFIIIFFVIFILPGIYNIEYFLNWVEGLILKEGKHGKGGANVIDPGSFSKNLINVFTKDILFAVSYFTILSTFVYLIYAKYILKKDFGFLKSPVLIRILTAILTAMTLQIIIVSKHYAQYYMIPSFMLSLTGLYISYLIICELFPGKFKNNAKPIYAGVMSALIIWFSYQIVSSYFEGREQSEDAMSMVNFIEKKYPDYIIIPSFGSANVEAPLAFASQYAGSRHEVYKEILQRKLRSEIYFNQWVNEFYYLPDNQNSLSILKSGKPVLLQLSRYGSIKEFRNKLSEITGYKNIEYNVIFTNENNESVYEIFMR